MIYRAIGLMSGSSVDGLDIAFVTFTEIGGKWTFEVDATDCVPFNNTLHNRLIGANTLSAFEYQLLDVNFGQFIAESVNTFIAANRLEHQVQLIASHGHTVFHSPSNHITAQLGNGATIAALTQLPVVSDLRIMDIAFGGQGAPIVAIGDKLLFNGYDFYLNIGGIANISFTNNNALIAYDICAANRVLNLLANQVQQSYDDEGKMAAAGAVNQTLLLALNELAYYKKSYPKSLDNSFGVNEVFPLISSFNLSINDALCTYVEHICTMIFNSMQASLQAVYEPKQMLVTGGGAFNSYLIQQLTNKLMPLNVAVIVPSKTIVESKEAIVMAFIGVLRWREEANVLHTVTGASRNSIGGALWLGTEA
jgi:anhydro-N-acetylmuramic acid kinase